MIEGSGSVFLTNGSGSRRPKNIWILQIQIHNTGMQNRWTPLYEKTICVLKFDSWSVLPPVDAVPWAAEKEPDQSSVSCPPVPRVPLGRRWHLKRNWTCRCKAVLWIRNRIHNSELRLRIQFRIWFRILTVVFLTDTKFLKKVQYFIIFNYDIFFKG